MRQYCCPALLTLLLSITGTAVADAVDEIEDLLTERWFEVEFIVFERLDVLDVNSTEQLTQSLPRQWPNKLMHVREPVEYAAPGGVLDGELLGIDAPSLYCLGFPILAEEDPLHPKFLPRQEPPPPDPGEMSRRAAEAAQLQAADDALKPAAEEFANALAAETPNAEPAPSQDGLLAEPITLTAAELPLTPYLQFLADVAEFEESLYDSSYRWLPELSMEAYVKAINRQSNLRLLVHRRWRAPIPAREAPQPIYLSSNVDAEAPATHAGFAKIEGHVSVTVGRFLHFAPTLWYHADNLGLAPVALPALHSLPGPQVSQYMELAESRRVRSGELHYLDHPKFGIVVRIDPVAIPQALLSSWEALDDTAEQTLQ